MAKGEKGMKDIGRAEKGGREGVSEREGARWKGQLEGECGERWEGRGKGMAGEKGRREAGRERGRKGYSKWKERQRNGVTWTGRG